jgi:hypothetical protein
VNSLQNQGKCSIKLGSSPFDERFIFSRSGMDVATTANTNEEVIVHPMATMPAVVSGVLLSLTCSCLLLSL